MDANHLPAHAGTCIEKAPRGRRYTRADYGKINQLNQQRVLGGHELGSEWHKRWPQHSELLIRFLDGPAALHQKVEAYAREWLPYINLTFAFRNAPAAQLRITFEDSGYWSWVGTDALQEDEDEATMCFGGWSEQTLANETLMRRTVLHEFGHALGCIHEHASPEHGIPWDIDKALTYYQQVAGWDHQQTYDQVLRRYDHDQVRASRWDPTSIMQYPVDPYTTIDGFRIDWNNELSEQDKRFVATMYPRDDTPAAGGAEP